MVSPIGGFGRSIPLQQAVGAAGAGGAAPAAPAAPVAPAAPPSATVHDALRFVADLWVPIKATDTEGRRSLRGQDERLQHWYYPKLGKALAAGRPRDAALTKLSKAQTASQLLIAINSYNSRAATKIEGHDIKRAAIALDPEFLKQSIKFCLDNIVNSANYVQAVDADYYEGALYRMLTSPLRSGAARATVVPYVMAALKDIRDGKNGNSVAQALADTQIDGSSGVKYKLFKITAPVSVAGAGAGSGASALPMGEDPVRDKIREIVKMDLLASGSAKFAVKAILQEKSAEDALKAANDDLKKAKTTEEKAAAQKVVDAAMSDLKRARAKTDAAIDFRIKEFMTGKNVEGKDVKTSDGESLIPLNGYADYPAEYSRKLNELYAGVSGAYDKSKVSAPVSLGATLGYVFGPTGEQGKDGSNQEGHAFGSLFASYDNKTPGLTLSINGNGAFGGFNHLQGMDKDKFGIAGPKNDLASATATKIDLFNFNVGYAWGDAATSKLFGQGSLGIVEHDVTDHTGKHGVGHSQLGFVKGTPADIQVAGAFGKLAYNIDDSWMVYAAAALGVQLDRVRITGDKAGFQWAKDDNGAEAIAADLAVGTRWTTDDTDLALQLHFARAGQETIVGGSANGKFKLPAGFGLGTTARVYVGDTVKDWGLFANVSRKIAGDLSFGLGGSIVNRDTTSTVGLSQSGGAMDGTGTVGAFSYPGHSGATQVYAELKYNKWSLVGSRVSSNQTNGDPDVTNGYSSTPWLFFIKGAL